MQVYGIDLEANEILINKMDVDKLERIFHNMLREKLGFDVDVYVGRYEFGEHPELAAVVCGTKLTKQQREMIEEYYSLARFVDCDFCNDKHFEWNDEYLFEDLVKDSFVGYQDYSLTDEAVIVKTENVIH